MATGNNSTGWVAALPKGISHVTAVPEFPIGSRVLCKGEEYVYVYAKTITCPIGYGVVLSASTSYSVTVSSLTDQDDGFIGVVKHVEIPVLEYGWVLSKGFAPVMPAIADTGLYIGDRIQIVDYTAVGNLARITSNTVDVARIPRGVVVASGITAASATAYMYGG